MSEKSKRLAELLARVPGPAIALPSAEGRTLLEVGFLCVLTRRLSESAAERTLSALVGAYPDWNELRVSQVHEFAHLVQSKSAELSLQVARDVREYLQEIYQKIHGFDLEVIRGDLNEASRFASQLPFLGASLGHYLLRLACPDQPPVSPALVRTLDRLGLVKRTTSLKKAQAALDGLVAPEQWTDFSIRLGRVVESWCDAKKPLCWECPLVDACPFGKKVQREWKASQRRLELQRARDEERARKEEEKQKKRAEADEKRRLIAKAKDDARRARESARNKAKGKPGKAGNARAGRDGKAKAPAAARAQGKSSAGGERRAAAKSKSAPKKTVHKRASNGAAGATRPKAPRVGRRKKA